MSVDEQNDFLKQIRNGAAWAVGAQIVGGVIAVVVLFSTVQAIDAKVGQVSNDAGDIKDSVKELRIEFKDVQIKTERMWWEREQRANRQSQPPNQP